MFLKENITNNGESFNVVIEHLLTKNETYEKANRKFCADRRNNWLNNSRLRGVQKRNR